MEKIELNEKTTKRIAIFKKGVNAQGYRLDLPVGWMHEMGITPDDRAVVLEFCDGKILISKEK